MSQQICHVLKLAVNTCNYFTKPTCAQCLALEPSQLPDKAMSWQQSAAKLRHEVGGTAAVCLQQGFKRLSSRQRSVARNGQLCCMYAIPNEHGIDASLAGTCTQTTAEGAVLHFKGLPECRVMFGRAAGWAGHTPGSAPAMSCCRESPTATSCSGLSLSISIAAS